MIKETYNYSFRFKAEDLRLEILLALDEGAIVDNIKLDTHWHDTATSLKGSIITPELLEKLSKELDVAKEIVIEKLRANMNLYPQESHVPMPKESL